MGISNGKRYVADLSSLSRLTNEDNKNRIVYRPVLITYCHKCFARPKLIISYFRTCSIALWSNHYCYLHQSLGPLRALADVGAIIRALFSFDVYSCYRNHVQTRSELLSWFSSGDLNCWRLSKASRSKVATGESKKRNYFFCLWYFCFQTETLIFLSVLFTLIVVGNCAVLATLLASKNRKSRMNFFIMHLAIAGKLCWWWPWSSLFPLLFIVHVCILDRSNAKC